MNPTEVLRIVDAIHREKHIDKEIVFVGVEAAIATAARKQYSDDSIIKIRVDRETGEISGTRNGEPISPEEMSERIGAQSAKQVMIQKMREAECDAIFEEHRAQIDQMVVGVVQRIETGKGKKEDNFRENGSVSIALQGVEAVLPRGEKIPGEVFHAGDRIRGIVIEVKKNGNRVKVILSRIRPIFVQKLFEQEIPEIQEAIIEIKGIAREPGYRTKIAVYSSDQRVDCVGACIGIRGSRIKNITEELNDERIDVVPWNADMQVFIPNALRPAEIEEVILCSMLGRAVILVQQDQRSLAIGRKGQNVRLASKLCGWDVEIMTREELEADIEKAIEGYALIKGIDHELADRLVGEGFLTFDDLSIIEPNDLAQMGNISMEEAETIIEQAEQFAEQEEKIKENQSNREPIENNETPPETEHEEAE
ncbi:MAG: transcription termination factor NusA [Planctomycetaceae bacterium]|jgi:N utilization substance protein A|nr:transcription termination factor NusA [Planctomycetaceae bacterium]